MLFVMNGEWHEMSVFDVDINVSSVAIDSTAGAADAGKLVKTDSAGLLDSTFIPTDIEAGDAETVDGADADTTPTASTIPIAGVSGKIDNGWLNTGSGNGMDSDTVDGSHAAAFATSGHTHDYSGTYLGLSAKAADSDKLDGVEGSGYATSGHDHTGTYVPISNTRYNSLVESKTLTSGTALSYWDIGSLNGDSDGEYLWVLDLKSAAVNSNKFQVTINPGFYDDFEDNAYTGRSAPYSDWTVNYGTPAIESAAPINGTYSVKHTGNNSNTIRNSMRKDLYYSPYTTPRTVNFNYKLDTTGVGSTSCPRVWLWILSYYGTGDFIAVETYYSNPNQLIRLYKQESSSATTIQSATLIASSAITEDTTYAVEIVDTGSHIHVSWDTVLKIDTDYTFSPSSTPTKEGFGSNWDTVSIWDNITIKDGNEYTLDLTSASNNILELAGDLKINADHTPSKPILSFGGAKTDNGVVSDNPIAGQYDETTNITKMRLGCATGKWYGVSKLYKIIG